MEFSDAGRAPPCVAGGSQTGIAGNPDRCNPLALASRRAGRRLPVRRPRLLVAGGAVTRARTADAADVLDRLRRRGARRVDAPTYSRRLSAHRSQSRAVLD